jgi:DNA-binding NtrC family response regulator
MVGTSQVFRAVRLLVQKVAQTSATVLIWGESGSGKELVANAIHDCSSRATSPFIAINCGAIAPALIEAELFGFERDSFTGAMRNHIGLVERASGGTLFLDEVTEMGAQMQTRLLRFLETRRFLRIGGSLELETDLRIIAATNRNPRKTVGEGALREDLFYRLAGFPIYVPPLRERGDDVSLLAEHYLSALNTRHGCAKRFSEGSLLTLRTHHWPGNVRELKNAVERAHIMDEHRLELQPMLWPSAVRDCSEGGIPVPIGSSLDQAERWLVEATLAHWGGDKDRTAKTLGCCLRTLYNKLTLYDRQRCEVSP